MIDRSLLLRMTLEFSANRIAYELRAAVLACDCVDFFQRLDRKADHEWVRRFATKEDAEDFTAKMEAKNAEG